MTATDTDVKRQYRKKSLMIHPDKFKHENGLEVSPSSYLVYTMLNRPPLLRHLISLKRLVIVYLFA